MSVLNRVSYNTYAKSWISFVLFPAWFLALFLLDFFLWGVGAGGGVGGWGGVGAVWGGGLGFVGFFGFVVGFINTG